MTDVEICAGRTHRAERAGRYHIDFLCGFPGPFSGNKVDDLFSRDDNNVALFYLFVYLLNGLHNYVIITNFRGLDNEIEAFRADQAG